MEASLSWFHPCPNTRSYPLLNLVSTQSVQGGVAPLRFEKWGRSGPPFVGHPNALKYEIFISIRRSL